MHVRSQRPSEKEPDCRVRSIAIEEIKHYFGWMAPFADLEMTVSSVYTQVRLGRKPTGPNLLADLAALNYSESVNA